MTPHIKPRTRGWLGTDLYAIVDYQERYATTETESEILETAAQGLSQALGIDLEAYRARRKEERA